jgi:hypothetical protein
LNWREQRSCPQGVRRRSFLASCSFAAGFLAVVFFAGKFPGCDPGRRAVPPRHLGGGSACGAEPAEGSAQHLLVDASAVGRPACPFCFSSAELQLSGPRHVAEAAPLRHPGAGRRPAPAGHLAALRRPRTGREPGAALARDHRAHSAYGAAVARGAGQWTCWPGGCPPTAGSGRCWPAPCGARLRWGLPQPAAFSRAFRAAYGHRMLGSTTAEPSA